jgi:outer membrane protein, multidrug efflux system
MKKITAILYVALAATQVACSGLKTPVASPAPQLPATYPLSADTAQNRLTWREHFDNPELAALIDTALSGNWDLKIASRRIDGSRADVLFSRGALQPMVNALAAGGVTRFGSYTMDGAGNNGTEIYNGQEIPVNLRDYFTGFEASWEADIRGRLRNKKRSALQRLLATVEGRNLVMTELVAETALTYYDLLALDETSATLAGTITLQREALELIREQKLAAAANELGVEQFGAQLLRLESAKLEVDRQISTTENQLNLLTGKLPGQLQRTNSLFRMAGTGLSKGVPADLLQNRPDIRQAERELQASRADLAAAKAAFYPSFTITAGAGFQAFRTGLLFRSPQSFTYSMLGSLSAPILNRSALKAEFRAADALQGEAILTYQKTVVAAYVEVYDQLLITQNLDAQLQLKNREAQLLDKSIDTSSELFRAARANYLEVLVARQNALQAKLELIDLQKMRLQASVRLYKALGGGWR